MHTTKRFVVQAVMLSVVLIIFGPYELFAWQSNSSCPISTMRKVNGYWISKAGSGPGTADWLYGVYHTGNMALYRATGDQKYLDYALKWANGNNWEMYAMRNVVASASRQEGSDAPANTLDNNLATRWSAVGDGQWIQFKLSTRIKLGLMAMAWSEGDQRRARFDIKVSNNPGSVTCDEKNEAIWETVYSGESSGATATQEMIDFSGKSTKNNGYYQYVCYLGHGNSSSNKPLENSLTEVDIYQVDNYADHQTCGQTYIDLYNTSARASSHDGNVPANTRDNNPATRWSAEGDGQWLDVDLQSNRIVRQVALAWYRGDQRQAFFDLQVSPDRTNWTTVLKGGKSSGKTIAPETFDFADIVGRYVRYVGHGNSSRDTLRWNSITKIAIATDRDALNDYRLASITEGVDPQLNRSGVCDWSWIDALFMAAPVFSKLCKHYNDPAYCNKLFAMYNATKNGSTCSALPAPGLFDPATGLWYRDKWFVYPQAKTPNGKKIFWLRGNGWVIAALTRVLEDLPATDSHRQEYMTMIGTMAKALKGRQRSDGFWNVSLDDTNHYPGPEASGTALITYALARGINKGYLDAATYVPVVVKAWDGMVSIAVQPTGALGYVQDAGDEPKDSQPVTVTSTRNYGVGAFLLAGSEVAKISGLTFKTTCTAASSALLTR